MSKDANSGITHNVLAAGTKVKGIIETESNFRLDGIVEGSMICRGKIVIGQQGIFDGDIQCENLEVMGKIKGTVEITDTLSLKSTSILEGDIKTKTLIIEPGAVFNGSCDMTSKKKDDALKKGKE